MINFIKILRPINLFITLICILLSSLIIDDLSYSLIPFIIAILCLVGFSNILNDIFDYQIDAANNLERPISSGAIKHWHAIVYSIVLLSIDIFSLLAIFMR